MRLSYTSGYVRICELKCLLVSCYAVVDVIWLISLSTVRPWVANFYNTLERWPDAGTMHGLLC